MLNARPTQRDRPKALVTGGAGFIGSHLCDSLLQDGWEVYALDDLSTGSLANVAHLTDRRDFHLVVDTVLNEAVVNSLVHRCDRVWHLAAAVGVRLIVEKPVHTLVTNVQGTEVVLDLCARFNKRVLVASTSEVYGDHQSLTPLNEGERRIYGPTTVNRWAYAGSKALDEFLALAYHKERDLDVVVTRLFNTVGPRQTGEYGMVVPALVEQALAGGPLTVFGDGLQTRCFCHVADTVAALRALVDDPSTGGEIYNVGNTAPIAIADLARRIIDLTGADADIEYCTYEDAYGEGFEDMRHRVPDVAKIHRAIGWAPVRDLDDILTDVIAHKRAAAVISG
ncbi:MAG: NAD-dependent epimerase/dehydratase family protein [Actinomycetota bacterium]